MPKTLKLAVSQSRTRETLQVTIEDLHKVAKGAASVGVDLILFPEAYLGGYPRTCAFGAAVGARTDEGREQFLHYYQSAVDLGDTPHGAGDDWTERRSPLLKGQKHRGDGTREQLEQIARETGIFIVTGVVERSGGSLYCAVLYICPHLGCLGKRRKVMPTGSERLIWAQGSPSTLKAITTTIKGVQLIMAAAICWENYMPLLRYSLYSQNVNLYLAPTADARETWLPLMQTVACESRAFVLSANQCVRRKDLPAWISPPSPSAQNTSSIARQADRRRPSVVIQEERHVLVLPQGSTSHQHKASEPLETEDSGGDEFVCRGGSCIVGPMGEVLEHPLWDVDDGMLQVVDADFADCERGRLDLDVAGSYSRNDAFRLTVQGLDLDPPC